MRLRREIFVVLYVCVLLFTDPQLTRAYTLEARMSNSGWIENVDDGIDPFLGLNDTESIHLVYALNGGINSNHNPDEIERTKLPFTLDIPVREGYNFAGWYTDSSYTNKITEINQENAANMVLFAKWTKTIDNRYNVEMYSYQTASTIGRNHKELKECVYDFVDAIEIPGMPSTRERDYLNNVIATDAPCMQGLCFTPEYVLMTAYAENDEHLGSLMVFERESGEYLATIGMKEESHLGGIAYDGQNVWVCHSGSRTLERISYDYIRKIAEDAPKYCIDASALSDEYHLKNVPSCITCYGGRIWVATHTKFFDSEMLSYSYDEESDKLAAMSSYRIPSKVQGVAFDQNGAVYLSTSYGRNNSSYLKVYSSLLSLTKKPNDPSMKVEMPPCSEQLAVANDNIYVVFESASKKYFEGTDGNGTSSSPIDKVLEVTVASVW